MVCAWRDLLQVYNSRIMIIHLHDRRVQAADLVSKLQHASAGFPLLLVGLGKLGEEAERPIAILEITIAALVLGTVAFCHRLVRPGGGGDDDVRSVPRTSLREARLLAAAVFLRLGHAGSCVVSRAFACAERPETLCQAG
jgi:hypothetical protein